MNEQILVKRRILLKWDLLRLSRVVQDLFFVTMRFPINILTNWKSERREKFGSRIQFLPSLPLHSNVTNEINRDEGRRLLPEFSEVGWRHRPALEGFWHGGGERDE